MSDQTDDLQHREDARPQRVQQDGDEQQRHIDEKQLPGRHLVVDPYNIDTHLDQLGTHIRPARQTRNPTQTTHPPTGVRRLLLPPGGRKLGHPMVLPAGGGRHAAHLGEAEHDGCVADHAAQKGPEEAAVARGAKRDGHGDDGKLPGGHVDGDEAECGPVREVAAELLGFAQACHVGGILARLVGGRGRQAAFGGGDLKEGAVLHLGDGQGQDLQRELGKAGGPVLYMVVIYIRQYSRAILFIAWRAARVQHRAARYLQWRSACSNRQIGRFKGSLQR